MQHSQYRHADEIVRRIRDILGDHPGYRALHADGRLYRGVFRANESAREYTRAVHMQGGDTAASVRFSKAGGDPFAHFGPTVGMATRFYLPGGQVTNLVMLSQRVFFASTVDQFLELLRAGAPSEPHGPPNREG